MSGRNLERSLNEVDPVKLLDQLDEVESEESLRRFIELGWIVLEPSRSFVGGWHIDAICDHLQAVTDGGLTRLLINVPPGCMKSLTTDVFWPAWEWGPRNRPDLRYVASSYSQDLTVRDNRRTRNLIRSSWYQHKWGDRFHLVDDQNAKVRFDTNKSGFKLATSVGGLGTGERGDRFVIDDPHNVKDGESEKKRTEAILWFTETVPTRVNDPEESAIIIIMQRVHEGDVSGEALARDLGYEHLRLPMEFEPERRCYSTVKPSYMKSKYKKVYYNSRHHTWQTDEPDSEDMVGDELITDRRYSVDPREEDNELLWPNRMSRMVVERDKKAMGTYACAGQFQQRPSPRGGGMFQRSWFEMVDVAPAGGDVCRGWDLAATETNNAAFTAGVRIKRAFNGIIYIEHCLRLRASPAGVDNAILNTASQDGDSVKISIPQDPGQAGKSQKKYMSGLLIGYDVHFSPESGSKEIRAVPLSAQAEAGNVKMVRGPWNGDFFDEIETFPNSKFKDQVDAASRAFAMLLPKARGTLVPAAPQPITLSGT